MKKSLSALAMLTATVFLTGCNQQPQPAQVSAPVAQQEQKCDPIMQGPSWIRSGGIIEGGLGVVGVSSHATKTSFKIDVAQADAYAKAGMQLKTIITGTLETLRDAHNELAKETMEKVFALDVKQIPISGLKQKDMWASNCSNDFFVWMVMEIDNVESNAKKVLRQVEADNKVIEPAIEVLNKKVAKMKGEN